MVGQRARIAVVVFLVALVTVVPSVLRADVPASTVTPAQCGTLAPCDPSTPLPRGERLSVELTTVPTELGVLCDDGSTGWYLVELSVRRVASDGAELARAAARGCVPPGANPFNSRVGSLLPNLVWAAVSER